MSNDELLSPKEKRRQRAKNLVIKHLGDEPKWVVPTDTLTEQCQLISIFNWYSYHQTKKEAKEYIVAYLESIDEPIKMLEAIKVLSEDKFITTSGWIARILSLSAPGISSRPFKALNLALDGLRIEAKSKLIKQVVKKERVDIQQILREQLSTYFSIIDEKVDEFIHERMAFSLKDWLSDRDMSAIQTKRILEKYTYEMQEFNDALNEVDEQLIEGYSNFTKVRLKEIVQFYKTMIADGNEWLDVAKEIGKFNRRPRSKKEKSPEQQVAKIKYQRAEESLGVKSIEPKKIIGANQVWIYNSKNRMLGVYNAANDRGLMVKGSTLYNFGKENSTEKKIRKPNDVLKQVIDGGKVGIRKLLEGIKAKEKHLTGRLNDNILILKVF